MNKFIRIVLTFGVSYLIFEYREFVIPVMGWFAVAVFGINWLNSLFRSSVSVINWDSIDWSAELENYVPESPCGDPDCTVCEGNEKD